MKNTNQVPVYGTDYTIASAPPMLPSAPLIPTSNKQPSNKPVRAFQYVAIGSLFASGFFQYFAPDLFCGYFPNTQKPDNTDLDNNLLNCRVNLAWSICSRACFYLGTVAFLLNVIQPQRLYQLPNNFMKGLKITLATIAFFATTIKGIFDTALFSTPNSCTAIEAIYRASARTNNAYIRGYINSKFALDILASDCLQQPSAEHTVLKDQFSTSASLFMFAMCPTLLLILIKLCSTYTCKRRYNDNNFPVAAYAIDIDDDNSNTRVNAGSGIG